MTPIWPPSCLHGLRWPRRSERESRRWSRPTGGRVGRADELTVGGFLECRLQIRLRESQSIRTSRGCAVSCLLDSRRLFRLVLADFERIRLPNDTGNDYKCMTSRSRAPTIWVGWRVNAIGRCDQWV